MLHFSEISGAAHPILNEKETGMFTYDEIIYVGENPSDYKVVGFIRINNDSDDFYEKVYNKA